MSKKLKILIYSPSYLPKIGGLENTIAAVAQAYVKHGHEVNVITLTPLNSQPELEVPYQIHRKPSLLKTLKIFHWCDVVHFPNVSLKGIWPLLFLKRTFCVSHHGTNYNLNGYYTSFFGRLKHWVSKYAHNTSCSSYINSLLPKKGEVIHSPYNERQFYIIPNVQRNKELVFLGRLVSDKGCQLILEALRELRKVNIRPSLSIIGTGAELSALQKNCRKYHLTEQVTFLGSIIGEKLNEKLNEHQILIAPSIWEEPFGKVAVEGLAAGCKVIISKSGGLPEAAGKFGVTFEKNNSKDLADKIQLTFTLPYPSANIEELEQHLNEHTATSIGTKYTQWIENSHFNNAKQTT